MTDHRQPSESALRAELRRAAAEHEPDRTAMLNRIAANRASRRAAGWQTARLAGAALAVAVVLGFGGIASWALTAHDPRDAMPAGPPPATIPAVTGSATPSPPASPSSRPATSRPKTPAQSSTSTPTPSRVRGHPGDTQVEKGSLWSDGSVDPAGTGASESTVTIKANVDLTGLDLTIRVALTPGLADRGATSDVAAGGITATVERRSDALLYRFVLREGATLPAGTYRFTARYGHDREGRDAGEDTYEAFGADADRKRPHVYGNFAATDK